MKSLIDILSLFKAQCVNKSLRPMVTNCDGCIANAEHQWQQQQHTHAVYVPPSMLYAQIAVLAMARASATDGGDY
jgi:hypothetical protein